MRQFWLFGKTDSELSAGKKWIFWGWNGLILLMAAVCLGGLSLFFAYGDYPDILMKSYLMTSSRICWIRLQKYIVSRNHFNSGHSRESIPNRIVSVSKPYVRPIVRGKETKTVEFGAKCNNILIDGISFIEKLSFNAFNEGTRLQHCVSLSEKLTGVPVKKIGGDQGYSGNDNRTFCKENKIETSFTQKGRSGKNYRTCPQRS